MSRLTLIIAVALASLPAVALSQPSSQTAAVSSASTANQPLSAIQSRADRANHDRWLRETPNTPAPSQDDNADADGQSLGDSSSDSDRIPRANPRELNGNLHLGDW